MAHRAHALAYHVELQGAQIHADCDTSSRAWRTGIPSFRGNVLRSLGFM